MKIMRCESDPEELHRRIEGSASSSHRVLSDTRDCDDAAKYVVAGDAVFVQSLEHSCMHMMSIHSYHDRNVKHL